MSAETLLTMAAVLLLSVSKYPTFCLRIARTYFARIRPACLSPVYIQQLISEVQQYQHKHTTHKVTLEFSTAPARIIHTSITCTNLLCMQSTTYSSSLQEERSRTYLGTMRDLRRWRYTLRSMHTAPSRSTQKCSRQEHNQTPIYSRTATTNGVQLYAVQRTMILDMMIYDNQRSCMHVKNSIEESSNDRRCVELCEVLQRSPSLQRV